MPEATLGKNLVHKSALNLNPYSTALYPQSIAYRFSLLVTDYEAENLINYPTFKEWECSCQKTKSASLIVVNQKS